MASFTRLLKFETDQETIVNPVTLMLTFDQIPSMPTMNQVAWRVINFGGGGQQATATYVQNLMVCSTQIQTGDLVTASASVGLNLGQLTTLIPSGEGVEFTTPVNGVQGEMMAINKTGSICGLGVGFYGPAGVTDPEPVLIWQNVGNTMSVQAKFTPILSAYVTQEYQQTQVIQGEIVGPVLLKQDLALLPDTQTYSLSMLPDGSFALTPVN